MHTDIVYRWSTATSLRDVKYSDIGNSQICIKFKFAFLNFMKTFLPAKTRPFWHRVNNDRALLFIRSLPSIHSLTGIICSLARSLTCWTDACSLSCCTLRPYVHPSTHLSIHPPLTRLAAHRFYLNVNSGTALKNDLISEPSSQPDCHVTS